MRFPIASGERVLITGGTGTLGQALIPELLACGARVRVMSRDECKQADLKRRWPDVDWQLGDVRDASTCRRAVARCEVVIHCAALKYIDVSEKQPSEYVQTNVLGTMNLLNAIVEDGGVRHAVGISTDKACQPFNAYGLTKGLLEKMFIEAAAREDIATVFNVCRYGNVLGSRGSVVLKWQELQRTGQRIKVTDPTMTRFFFTIWDAVWLIAEALTLPTGIIVSRSMLSTTLGDLASLWGDYDVIGPRPGEKPHEDLFSKHEMARLVASGRSLIFDPAADPKTNWDMKHFANGYTSLSCQRILPMDLEDLTREWRTCELVSQ